MIPYACQDITDEDVLAVTKALKSTHLTTGPIVKEFEDAIAKKVNARFAIAVSSGTAALHIACIAAGIGQGDEVIVPALTFAASANCVLYCQATPVFCDVTQQGVIDVTKLEEKITSKTKAIIPVHYAGLPCDLKKISEIAKKHNLIVIEDSCHALGGTYEQSIIGDCTYSQMSCFSFHPAKHITAGEGGLVTTNNPLLHEVLKQARTHGITLDPNKITYGEFDGAWRQDMQMLGNNYRLTDIQSALALSQLQRLDSYISRRQQLAKKYDEAFKSVEFLRPIHSGITHAYHLYVIKVKDAKTRLQLYNYLKEKDILCQIHYLPVYLHSYYQSLGHKKGECPMSEDIYDTILSIPLYPTLTDVEQQFVIDEIKRFFA